MKLATGFLACATLFSAALATHASFATSPDEIIAARRANQKRVGELTKSVDEGLKGGATAAALLDQIKEIDERAHLIKGYFPEGTQNGDTKAKPDVWSNRAGFDAAADHYVAAFDNLFKLAKTGDTAGLNGNWEAAKGTCGACHRDFKNR
jgi:cytochrome c556